MRRTAAPSPRPRSRRGATETVVVEHDLAAALRGIPDSARGWQRGEDLGALPELPGDLGLRRRPGGAALRLLRLVRARPPRGGEGRLPAGVAAAASRSPSRGPATCCGPGTAASGSRRPASPPEALTDTLKGVYVPYWTFDAKADATWTAEAGHSYYVEVNGKRERRVRWTPASGVARPTRSTTSSCAPRGASTPPCCARVEPFPTASLVPYDPGYLAGWVVERYQIDLVAAARALPPRRWTRACASCARGRCPGDTHRNLEVRARYRDQTFKHILGPLWLATYTHHGRGLPGRGQRRDRQGVRRPTLELGRRSPSPSLSPCWSSTW